MKKYFRSILRWGLRLHGAGHLIEVFSAISEDAYVTAMIACIFITIEILASFFIPDEHVHLKPIQSTVHVDCDDKNKYDL